MIVYRSCYKKKKFPLGDYRVLKLKAVYVLHELRKTQLLDLAKKCNKKKTNVRLQVPQKQTFCCVKYLSTKPSMLYIYFPVVAK